MNDKWVEIREDRKEKETTVLVHEQPEQTYRQGTHTDARLSIRTAASSDVDGLRAMFCRCSSETVYLRFHMPYPEVPGWMLALMLGVGRDDMEVLVAVADGDIIGHAMYVMLGDGEAEMAIVVEDGWQSKGVGKALLRELADDARHRGVETFVGSVLPDNGPMLGLIGTMFADSRRAFDDGALLVRMPLQALEPADLGRAA